MCLMAACSGRSASVRGGAGARVGKNLCCDIRPNRRPARGSAACTACSIVACIETRYKKNKVPTGIEPVTIRKSILRLLSAIALLSIKDNSNALPLS